jgi:hypothetical protein
MAVKYNKNTGLSYDPNTPNITTPKPVAPTSGIVPNFTPTVKLPAPEFQPGDAGFVGPVPVTPAVPDYGPIPYGTVVPGFTPEVNYPTGPAVGSAGFVGPVPVPTGDSFPTSTLTSEQLDAFALLKSVFTSYGLAEMVPSITKLMQANVGPNQAALMLKTDPNYNGPYLKRFAGNTARVAAGKNALDESTYLTLENRFREQLSAYGQDKYATQDEFAALIGNDIAPTELGSRLDLAVNQVQNADPNILNTLKQFYPTISQADLVGYFLKPDQALVDLTQKVTASEIGAAALQQNLTPLTTDRMLELQKLGVTQDTARTGFQNVATVLPEAKKLSSIYGEADINYTQQTGEEEFLQGTASAARKRRQLAQLEKGSFSGDSGVDTARGSSLARNMQGSF